MRDLFLWHRLGGGSEQEPDPDWVGDLLLSLARSSKQTRAPFYARLLRWADHDEPVIRASVMAALAGASGYDAWRVLVAGLDDEDDTVRATAVASLAQSCQHAPARYAHALFHPRPDVRRMALSGPVPQQSKAMVAYLRADPDLRDRAAAFPWPEAPLPLATDLYQRGLIAAADLVILVARHGGPAVRDYGLAAVGRSNDEISRFLAEARDRPCPEPPREPDALDPLVNAVAEDPPRAGAAAGALLAAVAGQNRKRGPRRLLAAVLACGVRRGFGDRLAAMAAALEPAVLEFACIPDDCLPALTNGLWDGRDQGPPLSGMVEDALATPRLRDPAGGLRLPLAVALIARARAAPTRTLGRQFGNDAVADALCGPDGVLAWTWLCQLPAETKPRFWGWLHALRKRAPERYGVLIAIALAQWAGHETRCRQLVDALDDADCVSAAVFALAELLVGDFVLSARRRDAFCDEVVRLLQPEALAHLIVDLLKEPADARVDLAAELARRAEADWAADALARVEPPTLRLLLGRGPGSSSPLTWEQDLALARRLEHTGDEWLASWAEELRLLSRASAAPAPAVADRGVALTEAQGDAIARAAEGDLEDALGPALRAPAEGLVDALARRPLPTRPHLPACVALLGCRDPLDAVAAQLQRFGGDSDEHEARLDHAVASLWQRSEALSALGHAFLYRWEKHLFHLADWVEGRGGLLPCLTFVETLPTLWVRRVFCDALAHLTMVLRYRDRKRLSALVQPGLVDHLCEGLDGAWGRAAAAMLVALVELHMSDVPIEAVRAAALDRAPDCDTETRKLLRRVVRLEGVPGMAPREHGSFEDALLVARSSDDIDELLALCRHGVRQVVEEAALRLLGFEGRGEAALASLAGELRDLPQPGPVAQSVALWSDEAAVAAVRALVSDASVAAETRFRLALGLCDRGEREVLPVAFETACIPADPAAWFGRADWSAMVALAGEAPAALGLAPSPHHRAATPAVEWLIAHGGGEPEVRKALRGYLDVEADRPLDLRRSAARALVDRFDDWFGEPVLLELAADESAGEPDWLVRKSTGSRRAALVEDLVEMALVGGRDVCTEGRALAVARCPSVPPPLRTAACQSLLTRGLDAATRRVAASHLTASQRDKLGQIARSFAWGVRRSQELTGSLFRIHLTSAEADFGHTYLDKNRVFVSALPVMRGERDGKDIVEGLILHELGHHMFHRGDREDTVWARAERDGLGRLLNLVADEHLERNLRALNPDYGDRLKKLDAYAFMHAVHDQRVDHLLEAMLGHASAALAGTRLDVAFDDACVRLRRGDAIGELDRMGHPLARFSRALRMGLGNRRDDPVVAEALGLFGKGFRKLDMEGLYAVTRRLAGLFGGAVAVASVFGGPEDLPWGERDRDAHGVGIDDDILQREVERILDPGKRAQRRSDSGKGRLQINVSPDIDFDRIDRVERVRGGDDVYRACVPEVRRHSSRLRHLLRELGLQWQPVGARVSGRALDRSRLRSLVTRGDPRILRARQPVLHNDLFLGVVIDCSGSMVAGDNIARAQRFAVLIAEAVRDLRGVDARFFGFTDSMIYDAGSAEHCAVGALKADGGNNDAAGLYHAATVAEQSRRRARVLVMVSDGLPTECSTEALKALVSDLGRRRGICCAQVAVRPLEEVCFPNYVVLDDELDVAVARFGGIIGDLARRTLAS